VAKRVTETPQDIYTKDYVEKITLHKEQRRRGGPFLKVIRQIRGLYG